MSEKICLENHTQEIAALKTLLKEARDLLKAFHSCRNHNELCDVKRLVTQIDAAIKGGKRA